MPVFPIVGFILFLIYGGGAWKFWGGFDKTFWTRSISNRLLFSLLWPAWTINKAGRRNLGKALKG